ncbi:MAG: septum formation initiator family protein [Candidatus Zixiibacteriota bacterium]|nr:MAG: septum formation initiator family protein [candidate division Zixibacteria bacterium]
MTWPGGTAILPSFPTGPGKPRTPPSPTWPWPPAWARSRPDRPAAPTAWPSTTNCCASKRNWAKPDCSTEKSGSIPSPIVKSPERNPWQGVGRRIILILLFLALAATFIFGQRGLLQYDELRQQCRQMEARNDSLEREIAGLTARIRALESGDSLELERAARRWGLVRPGEEIFLIKEETDTTQAHR